MEHAPQAVLVVEDDDAVRHLLARLLQHDGYAVLSAAGPAEALSLAEAHRDALALALVDLHLKEGARGEEVIEALHAAIPGLPLATMSGGAETGRGMVGVVGHLLKPFVRADLQRLVRETRSRGRRALNREPSLSLGTGSMAGRRDKFVACAPRHRPHDQGMVYRILVVEDDEGLQAALRRTLQRAGYEVLLAHGLEEALRQIRADETVSLALVDLNLEDVSGEHAVGALRAVAPDLPIVTMSGGNRSGMGLPGVLRHLSKPFPFEDLLDLVRRHFGA